jgi:ABC-2 type transport system permease protein
MTTLIRIELAKLRTTRMAYGLLATAAGLTALFSVLEASRAGTSGGVAPLYTASGVTAVVTGGVWSLLFAAVFGVTIASGEFRHHTATQTYLATPSRGRVLAAKTVAAALAGAVFGLVGYLIAGGTALAFVFSHGYHLAISDATLARYGAGHLLAGALMAAIGVAVGSLVRSQLAGVIGVFVWSIVIESLIGGLFNSVQPYLPYTAATTLSGTAPGQGAFGPAHHIGSGTALPFAGAAGLLAGLAAVLCLLAARTTVRRDIS